jgi:hypothetical protein
LFSSTHTRFRPLRHRRRLPPAIVASRPQCWRVLSRVRNRKTDQNRARVPADVARLAAAWRCSIKRSQCPIEHSGTSAQLLRNASGPRRPEAAADGSRAQVRQSSGNVGRIPRAWPGRGAAARASHRDEFKR